MSNTSESLKSLTGEQTASPAYMDGKKAAMALMHQIASEHGEVPAFEEAMFASFTTLSVFFYDLLGKTDAEKLIRASSDIAHQFSEERKKEPTE